MLMCLAAYTKDFMYAFMSNHQVSWDGILRDPILLNCCSTFYLVLIENIVADTIFMAKCYKSVRLKPTIICNMFIFVAPENSVGYWCCCIWLIWLVVVHHICVHGFWVGRSVFKWERFYRNCWWQYWYHSGSHCLFLFLYSYMGKCVCVLALAPKPTGFHLNSRCLIPVAAEDFTFCSCVFVHAHMC